MHLLPAPQRITQHAEGCFAPRAIHLCLSGPDDALPAQQLLEDWNRYANLPASYGDSPHPGSASAPILFQPAPDLPHEAYRLQITPNEITLQGSGSAGLFYAAQTLRQIIRQSGASLPCLSVEDHPRYPVRGFYHDVSRGKVPKLDTLLRLIEKLAHHKINHFELYIEHPFAFRNHAEIWAGSDPLTHEDIRCLDAHCRRYHIDFTPSLSTFGHCYRLIRNERNQHLNELPFNATGRPFSFRDAMTHYTLDCRNPDSLRLMNELIREYGANFSSPFFNICCDETFDLGKGKNAEAARSTGAGTLYADYLKAIMAIVQDIGKTPLFWGDILLNHRDRLTDLPKNSIILHWDYAPEPSEEKCRCLQQANHPFYVCSGVDGWRKCFNNINGASLNILRLSRMGLQYGASGFLNTDWGDIGHINFLSSSFHGLLLGAAYAWNTPAPEIPEEDALRQTDDAIAALEWGDPHGESVRLMRETARHQQITWGDISMWRDPSPDVPAAWRDAETGFPQSILAIPAETLSASRAALRRIEEQLEALMPSWHPQDDLACEEWRCSLRGADLMMAIGQIMQEVKASGSARNAAETADRLRRLEQELSTLWHRRNRPSEYYHLRSDLLDGAEHLDRLQARQPQ